MKKVRDVAHALSPFRGRGGIHNETPNASGSSTSAEQAENPYGLRLKAAGENPRVDIVAVHGLDGHVDETWTFGEDGPLWLRDFLPKKIPFARIWTWGYDSRTHSKDYSEQLSIKSLSQHGEQLIFDLELERKKTKTTRRPIIFVAHSLGGIVIKSALLHSDRVRPGNLAWRRSIKLSTYGIVFMGTPHQGAPHVDLAQVLLNIEKARGHTSTRLSQHLREHSEYLRDQQNEFKSIVKDFKIICVYEEKPYPIAKFGSIVPDWSAIIGIPDIDSFGIHDHHKGMTKYPSLEDKGYDQISECLLDMTRVAATVVETNWLQEDSREQAALGKQSYVVNFDTKGVAFAPNYVLRSHEIEQMNQHLRPDVANTQRNTLVLHGLGGSGKTQLSLAFAREHKRDYSAIFWLDGQSKESLRRSIASIAKRLPVGQISESARTFEQGISQNDCQPINPANSQGSSKVIGIDQVLREVLDWFKKDGNDRWLLIYDNNDREKPDPESYDISQFLPESDQGSVIITTRRPQLSYLGKDMKISGMTQKEALELLSKRVGSLGENLDKAFELIEELGRLPLALAQAGSSIKETGLNIEQYLATYNTTWNRLMEEEEKFKLLPEYGDRSLYTTWTISFESVSQKDKAAARMLQLWACLDHNDIWFGLLHLEESEDFHRNCAYPEWFGCAIDSIISFMAVTRLLLAYSLIQKNDSTSDSYSVHPVVHRWCYEMLTTEEKKALSSLAVNCVAEAIACYGGWEHWKTRLRLLPHTNRCYCLTKTLKGSVEISTSLDAIRAFRWFGALYIELEMFVEAEEVLLEMHRAFESQEIVDERYKACPVSESWEELGRIYLCLGTVYYNRDDIEMASDQYKRVLEVYQRSGYNGTWGVAAIHNLGSMCESRGDLHQAETLYQTASSLYKRAGVAHSTSLCVIFESLGKLFRRQDKFSEAEEVLKRALEGWNVLGIKNVRQFYVLWELGTLYLEQHQLPTAESLLVKAVEFYELIGEELVEIFGLLGDLGTVYLQQGKTVEAEAVFQKATESYAALGIFEGSFNIMMNLTYIARDGAKLSQARKNFDEALTCATTIYPESSVAASVYVCFIAISLGQGNGAATAEDYISKAKHIWNTNGNMDEKGEPLHLEDFDKLFSTREGSKE